MRRVGVEAGDGGGDEGEEPVVAGAGDDVWVQWCVYVSDGCGFIMKGWVCVKGCSYHRDGC